MMKTKLNKIVLAVFLLTICLTLKAQQTVTDIDGNVYNTVTIGSQKWMVENLRATHYSDSTTIPNVTDASVWANLTTPGMCTSNNTTNTDTINTYGRLYNWYAVNTNKLAPIGWHVPTDAEFTILENYLIANGYNYDGTTTGNKIAKSLASATGWVSSSDTGAVGNTDFPAKRNATGFTALPGGFRGDAGLFINMGTEGNWWSSSNINSDHANHWDMIYNLDNTSIYGGYKWGGYSVRCIEDPIPDSAKYFGQTPPGDTAVVFTPDIFSNFDDFKGKTAFSPNGNEFYFSMVGDSFKIYFTNYENRVWTTPVEAPFSGSQHVLSPYFSTDGNRLYFTRFNSATFINQIYMVERIAGAWGDPELLPSPINLNNESDYSETLDSVAYISSDRNNGDWDIWRVRHVNTSYQVESLGPTVNATGQDSYPCVAPDGSFLIFSSTRSGKIGYQDLYISFNKGNDEWTRPINMEINGAGINVSQQHQAYPSLSPDGKYLFFTRHSPDGEISDIYWVSTSIIDTLKTIAIPTSVDLIETKNLISVFPNPTTGQFTILFDATPVQKVRVEIYNLQGARVLERTFQGTTSETIDLTDFSKGIYWIKIDHEGSFYSNKLIVK
jgi:uncharacterized protein (TIGR02145 family)